MAGGESGDCGSRLRRAGGLVCFQAAFGFIGVWPQCKTAGCQTAFRQPENVLPYRIRFQAALSYGLR